MTMQQFKEFYRSKGIQTLGALTDPSPELIKKLPINSVLHVLGDSENPGLDSSETLLKGYKEKIMLVTATEYDPEHTTGTARSANIQEALSKFLKLNRNFLRVRDFNLLKAATKQQLIAVDYSRQDQFYRVQDTKVGNFNQLESKLWSIPYMIRKIDAIRPREHFVLIPIPASLVPKSILDSKALATQPQLSNSFYGIDEQFLRHVWLAINPSTAQHSMLGGYGDMYRRVNLVFKSYDGRYTILNLGYLMSFIAGNPNMTFLSSISTKPFTEVQKYYLKSMISLQTIELSGASAAEQERAQEEKEAKLAVIDKSEEEGSELDQRFLQDIELEHSHLQNAAQLGQSSPTIGDTEGVAGAASAASEPKSEIDEVLKSKEIDKDLEALEVIAQRRSNKVVSKAKMVTDAEVDTYTSEIPEDKASIEAELLKPRTPKEALIEKLNKLADEGRITSAEFRRKKELIEKSDTIPDPYGSGKTVAEASKIKPEDLVIDEKDAVMDAPEVVIDKSMTKSSLRVVGPKYNTEIIYKDILSSIQAVQRGGVIVKNHTVDRQSTVLGDFDVHTVEIVPLNGQPSIVRAKIPLVDEEGTFTAKGTKYAMRVGRVDVPIRKIGSNRVGLSSYYGKTFVDRAAKKADSSLAFVLSRLAKATIQPDEHLRDVSPGNVFDNYFEAPYFYSGISESYQSLKAGNYDLDFNSKGMRSKLSPEVLKTYEVNGSRICGHVSGRNTTYVVIDKENKFYTAQDGTLTPVGDIYDILGLDRQAAPIDFAELKVFSKSIPVGVYLAKTIGFRKLVKLLGAKHRLVEGRQQKNLQPDEYVVQFKDVAYIFSKKDETSTMVLAGFRAFEKETKLYNAELFDSPDIYLRLLEAKGLNVAYFREMENLQDMFIDPITERILKEMGEPTNFNGLLIRSCELLKNYYYPASQDADYQRNRGYDRFAGFFYKDMVNAVRAYKQKNSTGRAKVDMSPYQVWTTITRDSTVKQVEENNPIQALKITQEAVTYVGEGGRGKESMNRESRAYMTSDLGITSEASVDSSDVGINVFLSADPEFANINGTSKKERSKEAANLLSTSALLAPFSTNDD